MDSPLFIRRRRREIASRPVAFPFDKVVGRGWFGSLPAPYLSIEIPKSDVSAEEVSLCVLPELQ